MNEAAQLRRLLWLADAWYLSRGDNEERLRPVLALLTRDRAEAYLRAQGWAVHRKGPRSTHWTAPPRTGEDGEALAGAVVPHAFDATTWQGREEARDCVAEMAGDDSTPWRVLDAVLPERGPWDEERP